MSYAPFPFYAYLGRNDYIFAAYEKQDYAIVFRELERLFALGYRVWYEEDVANEGLAFEETCEKVRQCKLFIFFITEHAENSKELRRVVNYALDIEVPMLLIYLEQVELPKSLQLSTSHVAPIHRYKRETKDYERELSNRLNKNLRMTRQEKQVLTIGDERICPTHIKIKLAHDHLRSSQQPIPPDIIKGSETEKQAQRFLDNMRGIAQAEYEKLAEMGHPEAQFELSCLLCVKNRAKALEWLQKSVEAGFPPALVEYGELLTTTPAFSEAMRGRNLRQAGELFSKAAKAKSADGLFRLAECFHLDMYRGAFDRDLVRAAKLYVQSAQMGHDGAKERLYEKPYEMTQYLTDDPLRREAAEFAKAADAGDDYAVNNLAMQYLRGEGVPRDANLAVKMLAEAAERGNPYALFNLGMILYEGKIMGQDRESAVKMIRYAAAKGLPAAVEAMKNLGEMEGR